MIPIQTSRYLELFKQATLHLLKSPGRKNDKIVSDVNSLHLRKLRAKTLNICLSPAKD